MPGGPPPLRPLGPQPVQDFTDTPLKSVQQIAVETDDGRLAHQVLMISRYANRWRTMNVHQKQIMRCVHGVLSNKCLLTAIHGGRVGEWNVEWHV